MCKLTSPLCNIFSIIIIRNKIFVVSNLKCLLLQYTVLVIQSYVCYKHFHIHNNLTKRKRFICTFVRTNISPYMTYKLYFVYDW